MGKRCLILRYAMLILFCVSSVFNIASQTKANVSIADDLQTNVGHSFPKEANRTRRSLLAALGVGISLLDFTVTNIGKTFNKGVEGKELISHLKRIQNELESQNRELQSISQNIKMLGLSLAYSRHEEKIKGNLLALQQYLEHPSDHYRNVFIEQGKHLNQEINYLIDGLLGQNTFGPDIMAAIRDATKCHGQKMRKNVQYIFSIIMTGLWVRGEYQRIIEIKERESSHFKESIMAQMKLTKRLDDMLIECQADEGNISHEMRQIMENTLGHSKKSVADSLLEFLENKYDTKGWIVVLLSRIKWKPTTWDTTRFSDAEDDWIACSKGLHKTTYKNDIAVAVSVDGEGDFSATRNLMGSHFKEFEIPLWDNGPGLTCTKEGRYFRTS